MTLLEKVVLFEGMTLTKNLSELNTNQGYQVSIKDLLKIKVENLTNDYLINILNGVKWELENGQYIGLWIDKGLLYIDISVHESHYHTAIEMGRRFNQKAIFDWHDMKSVWL
jgi:hypothetical protein